MPARRGQDIKIKVADFGLLLFCLQCDFHQLSGLFFVFGLLAQAAVAHTLSRATKYAKRSFFVEGRKLKNHRQSFYALFSSLLFLLTFFVNFSQYLSVIFQFLLSASRTVFSQISALRQLFGSVTATFCCCHTLYISHCLLLSFTLYSLPQSLSDVSLGFCGVGLMLLTRMVVSGGCGSV